MTVCTTPLGSEEVNLNERLSKRLSEERSFAIEKQIDAFGHPLRRLVADRKLPVLSKPTIDFDHQRVVTAWHRRYAECLRRRPQVARV